LLVGLAEAAKVRDDHVGAALEQWGHIAIVPAIPGPSMEQDHRRTRAPALIRQSESVNG